ncbi:translation initiation factor IF-2 [Plectosphaerella plurivora]|uniref:Translation initiation factor IF-2, mitochondrial n=1 Tax=Plectosphaerella plurivora TaxID=936078 RepID=A0A9P9A5Q3_9PEZI|nr:translation initiation factor IF-2 [Plectosphaerella plurivora]
MIRCRGLGNPSSLSLCRACQRHGARSSPLLSRSHSTSQPADSNLTPAAKGLSATSGWGSKVVPRPIPPRGAWSTGSGILRRPGTPATGEASQPDTPSAPKPVDDSLLPHERAAKLRLAAAAQPKPEGRPAAFQRKPSNERPAAFQRTSPQRSGLGAQRPGKPGKQSHEAPRADEPQAIEQEKKSPFSRTHPAGFTKPHAVARPKHQHDEAKDKPAVWGSLRKREDRPANSAPSTSPAPSANANNFWEKFKDRVASGPNQNGASPSNTTSATPVASNAHYWEPENEQAAATTEETAETPAKTQDTSKGEFDTFDRREKKKRDKIAKTFQGSKGGRKGRQSRFEEEDEEYDEEAALRAEERRLRKAERKAQKQMDAMEAGDQGPPKILLPEYINLFNLAEALKLRPKALLQALEEMGFENITEDSIFTGETASLIALEYGFDPTVDTGGQRDLRPRPPPEDLAALPSRPPVVTIMGHVDHGKTTLLDFLRKSSVAAQEHGGITQHIGAFIVKMSSGKRITFLDTPGHAAFLTMRQRGANVTDIVVLVVAADDSVMPQTLEAIKHAREAKVPMIVAINKIDKEDARPDQVKADLARHGVEIEDFGGDVQVVPVSGKTGQGMDDLEENISLLSDILDARAETDGLAEGWVLEASVKPVGKSATVLVRRGTLRQGDFIVAGTAWARVRLLRNEAGMEVSEAPPGTPVEIIGWRDELPAAGDEVLEAPDEDRARTAIEYRNEMRYRQVSSQQLLEQEQRERERLAAEAAENDPEAEGSGTTLVNFTVKCDVAGSVEAICASIQELGNNEVQPRILRSSAGQVSEFDIDHAATSRSIIVNFNSAIPPHIKRMAEDQGVRIIDHTVIYHLTDDVKAALSEKLDDVITHKVVGDAEVLQIFPINIKGRVYRNIAGCKVRNGLVSRNALVRIIRKGEKIYDGKVEAIKHGKKDVSEMRKGTECGISFEDFEDMQPGDQLQLYEEVREKRTL